MLRFCGFSMTPRGLLGTLSYDDVAGSANCIRQQPAHTCSPNRPSPLGLRRARIVARAGLRIEAGALEAIDGTPVVDVKPATGPPA